jgi:DNA-binding transcriptional regulator YiaG
MKPLYKLHMDGQVIESGRLEEVKRIASQTEQYFEIYMHIPSVMFKAPAKIKAMDIQDMREALRLSQRGYAPKQIATKFGINVDYLRKVLRQMKTETI